MSSIDQVYGVYGVRGHVRAFKAATCRRTPKFIAGIIAGTFVTSALFSAFAQEKSDEELVKELSNPVASLISVPFQSNFEFKLGPNNDGFRYTLNFSPLFRSH